MNSQGVNQSQYKAGAFTCELAAAVYQASLCHSLHTAPQAAGLRYFLLPYGYTLIAVFVWRVKQNFFNVSLFSSILDLRSNVSYAVKVQNVTFYLRVCSYISVLPFGNERNVCI